MLWNLSFLMLIVISLIGLMIMIIVRFFCVRKCRIIGSCCEIMLEVKI